MKNLCTSHIALSAMHKTVTLLTTTTIDQKLSGFAPSHPCYASYMFSPLCCPDLPRLSSYSEALLAHPAVAASLAPPEGSKPYFEQLLEQYKINVARRKAAAAAAK